MHKLIKCDLRKIGRKYDLLMLAVNIPSIAAALVLLCVSRLVIIPLKAPADFYKIFFGILYAAALYAFAVTAAAAIAANKKINGCKRNTYIEILGTQLILSEYISTAVIYGEKYDYKRLWIINLADISEVVCTKNKIIVKGRARRIEERSDRLAYAEESGRAAFDYWWYSENGGEILMSAEIKDDYFYSERIAQRIIFCSERQKKREIQRAEFRRRMLEIAGRKGAGRKKKPRERVFRGYEIERKF